MGKIQEWTFSLEGKTVSGIKPQGRVDLLSRWV